jgi:hypothetical protein
VYALHNIICFKPLSMQSPNAAVLGPCKTGHCVVKGV